jgi:hypothetical protein
MSGTTDRLLAARAAQETLDWIFLPPPAKQPKPWLRRLGVPPKAWPWTDIAVIATLGVAYLVTVLLHGAGLGAL